ncbi:type IV secretion system protein [Sphingomonas phyllosphaerae]|uniref:type IV secretion system protein n=1 Tax=Sphingomonas phyllosphaerae TaxID=257003 RepID=UPI0003B5935F|nr:type IV secretion system protein [Sphingomonas phyllosphaerae]
MMAAVCALTPAPDRFASGLMQYLDCQASSLGSQGFMAMAAPGSSVSLLLSALLTIFIALIGYRLLFGETLNLRDGVLAFVKIGIVLAFATSWPAYRTVVFDVVLRAPAEVAGEIGRPAGLPGATGGLTTRMDAVDRAFRILAIYGAGVPTRQQVEEANGVAPPLFANFDAFALGAARVVFLVGGLGAFALTRITAGLLLALGPLFIAFLLFSVTRGLAEGWVRGLAAATLGSAAIAVALGIELALLEPWLYGLASQRAGGLAIPGAPAAILTASIIFALAISGLVALAGRIAFGLRLPVPQSLSAMLPNIGIATTEARIVASSSGHTMAENRSRAMAIADSIVSAQRRDERASGGASRVQTTAGSLVRSAGAGDTSGGTPIGQSFRRRNARRVSAGATARDRQSGGRGI